MEKVRGFETDILIIPLGLDTLSTDPDASRLYGCGLEVRDFRVVGRFIKESFKGKIVVTQEGGYDLDSVPDAVDGFLRGLIDL
jgi:acetoin utilization deacetylase AcuC-like enzyme